jgi:hypothetical protein
MPPECRLQSGRQLCGLASARLILLPGHDARRFPAVSSQTSGLMCLRSGRVCLLVRQGWVRWHAHPRQGLQWQHCECRSQHYPLRIGFGSLSFRRPWSIQKMRPRVRRRRVRSRRREAWRRRVRSKGRFWAYLRHGFHGGASPGSVCGSPAKIVKSPAGVRLASTFSWYTSFVHPLCVNQGVRPDQAV